MKLIFFSFALAVTAATVMKKNTPPTGTYPGVTDTLKAQVARWDDPPLKEGKLGSSVKLLSGATHDLSALDIRAFTLRPEQSSPAVSDNNDADALVIVASGELAIPRKNSSNTIGPGGVALFSAGEEPVFTNTGNAPVTFYVFHFQSRGTKSQERARKAGPPFVMDWKQMVMKPTSKGESRQIFNRPVAWLKKIDMHATTLNGGEVSHAPHTHRAEEIILMRSGNVRMYIDGKYYPASAGDVVFLPSGSLHALENKGKERCEYFALQWQL